MTNKIPAGLLVLLFAIMYLLPLQGHPLFTPDETRYAEVPREMVLGGDWVVPRLNGIRYFEKPVMGYWMSAISLSVFGENNFAVRLPSALATGLTALLIFYLCSSYCTRGHWLPWLATFVYLSSLMVAVLGTLAILDTPLTLFLTATLVFFFKATEEPAASSKERWFLFAAGIFAGCAFLTKGFLAFAIPVLAVGPYLLLQGRWRDTLRMLLLPVIGAICVSLPWALLIHQREPDFWNYFFWYEHVHRFLSDTAQHSEPFWFFLVALPVMLMPWTLFLPAVFAGFMKKLWPTKQHKRLVLFCCCWFLFPLLFFSASSGKLITYILPCFAPLAILFAHGMNQWLDTGTEKRTTLQWGIGILLALTIVVLVVIPGVHLFGPERLWIYDRSWKWLLLSSGLSTMLTFLCIAFRSKQDRQKIILFGLSFVVFLFALHFTIPQHTLDRKSPGPFLTSQAADITPDTYILSGEEVLRAVCWYLKRDDVYLVEQPGELRNGMKYEDGKYKLLNVIEAGKFIQKHSGQVVLIADHDEYSYWRRFLPEPLSVDSSGSDGYLWLSY